MIDYDAHFTTLALLFGTILSIGLIGTVGSLLLASDVSIRYKLSLVLSLLLAAFTVHYYLG